MLGLQGIALNDAVKVRGAKGDQGTAGVSRNSGASAFLAAMNPRCTSHPLSLTMRATSSEACLHTPSRQSCGTSVVLEMN